MRIPDPRTVVLVLDGNVLQSSGAQGRASERLLELNREGEVDCVLPPGVAAEVMDPRTPVEVRLKAQAVRTAPPSSPTGDEGRLLDRLREAVQGQAAAGRHAADAANLAEAYRLGPVFVTNDRRLLKRRDVLAQVMPGLRVASPAEVMDAYDACVAQDDNWRAPH